MQCSKLRFLYQLKRFFALISIRKLRKSFHAQQGVVNALKEIDLEVAEGDFCVLLGPSGCGRE